MPCYPLKDKNGKVNGFMCSRKKIKEEPEKCYVCGKRAVALCDFPIPGNDFGSCNKPMCKDHLYHVGEDNDVCHEHYNELNIKMAQANRERLKGLWSEDK